MLYLTLYSELNPNTYIIKLLGTGMITIPSFVSCIVKFFSIAEMQSRAEMQKEQISLGL